MAPAYIESFMLEKRSRAEAYRRFDASLPKYLLEGCFCLPGIKKRWLPNWRI